MFKVWSNFVSLIDFFPLNEIVHTKALKYINLKCIQWITKTTFELKF